MSFDKDQLSAILITTITASAISSLSDGNPMGTHNLDIVKNIRYVPIHNENIARIVVS